MNQGLKSNEIMQKIGFILESEDKYTKTYVRKARVGIEVCAFMDGKNEPHFFWQRKRGERKDLIVYDVNERGMLQALKLIKNEKGWKGDKQLSCQEESSDKREIKDMLKKLREELNESSSY